MLIYTAIKASYIRTPLIASPTISEIATEKITLPAFPILVFSFFIKDFTSTYIIEAIKNLIKEVPPKIIPVVIEINTQGIISGTPAEFIAANIEIPNGVAP